MAIPRARRCIFISILASVILTGFYFRHHVANSTKSWPQITWGSSSSPVEPEPEPPQARTSHLHYLIPVSGPNLPFCFNLVSSLVNRFPVPVLLGWHGVGELDAATTHLAKLRVIARHLDSLSPGDANTIHNDNDDDLVIIVDGYDVLAQLPPEIMVERYFGIVAHAESRLAQRLGLTVQQLHAHGLGQTVFWGADKLCWPIDPRAPRCWAAPPAPVLVEDEANVRGAAEAGRWFNSGTVIGPLGDLRRFVTAALQEIEATYDPLFEKADSDQYYLSNVWGLQEYRRAQMASGDGVVKGGPPDRIVPQRRTRDQQTEFHVAIDYESALFQTKFGYEEHFGQVRFDDSDGSATLPGGANVSMPPNVEAALTRLVDGLVNVDDWIRTVELGINYVTHHIYAMWHGTGPKDDFIDAEYDASWFRSYVEPLLRANVRASSKGEPISSKIIDGRRWVAQTAFPDDLDDDLGGAWTDLDGGGFVSWRDLCGKHQDRLFGGL